MFVFGYVIYGLIAVFLVIIPNALAFWLATEVPFPTLYTVANLERGWRLAAKGIVAGLVVLMFHLCLTRGRTSPPWLTAHRAHVSRTAGASAAPVSFSQDQHSEHGCPAHVTRPPWEIT